MKIIPVKDLNYPEGEDIGVRIGDCRHVGSIVEDFEDFTDASGGYGNELLLCLVCGQEWTPRAFREQFDPADSQFDWSD